MDDSKIIELFFLRNEDAIRHTHDAYGRRLFVLADNIVRNCKFRPLSHTCTDF